MRRAVGMPTVGRGDHQRSWPAVAPGSLHFRAGGRQQPRRAAPRHDDPSDHVRGLEVTGHGPVPQDHLQGVESRHLGLAQLGDLLIGAALTDELQGTHPTPPSQRTVAMTTLHTRQG